MRLNKTNQINQKIIYLVYMYEQDLALNNPKRVDLT